METVKQLNKQEFTTKVADIEKSKGEWKFLGERPAVIDFFATWCGPCKALAPVLDELAADYQYKDRIDFYKVDIDQEQDLAAVFGVRSVPTLLFIPLNGMPQMMTSATPTIQEGMPKAVWKHSPMELDCTMQPMKPRARMMANTPP
jgi:thioredoxin